jgi:hypothetical protein
MKGTCGIACYEVDEDSTSEITDRDRMLLDLSCVISVNESNKKVIINELINSGWVKS